MEMLLTPMTLRILRIMDKTKILLIIVLVKGSKDTMLLN